MNITQKNYDLIVESYADKALDRAREADSDPTSTAFKAKIDESVNVLYSQADEDNALVLLDDFAEVTPFDAKPEPGITSVLGAAAAKGLYHEEPSLENYEPAYGNVQRMIDQLGVMAFEQDVKRKTREKAKRIRERYTTEETTETS